MARLKPARKQARYAINLFSVLTYFIRHNRDNKNEDRAYTIAKKYVRLELYKKVAKTREQITKIEAKKEVDFFKNSRAKRYMVITIISELKIPAK